MLGLKHAIKLENPAFLNDKENPSNEIILKPCRDLSLNTVIHEIG